MVELVDTLDLKSNGHYGRAGSSPAFSTNENRNYFIIKVLRFFNVLFSQLLVNIIEIRVYLALIRWLDCVNK